MGTPPPANPGNGFYFTHPIHPNQSAITWRMYYAAGQRVAMRVSHGPTTNPYPAPGATQDEVYYLLGDHLGSTTVTVNLDGTVKSRVRYDAWGKTRNSTGTTPTDRKYTGQIEEATVGLYFYNARWYDASLGRFIQADTIIPQPGSPLAWDRYAYTYSNPIRYSDPTGHCFDGITTTLCIAMAAGAIAGYAVQVGENRSQGKNWGEAFTTNISAEKILSGAVIAGGVIVGAAVVSAGLAAVGITAGAACMDGDCTNELNSSTSSIKLISSDISSTEQIATKTTAIQSYYPPNLGFSEKPRIVTLQPGMLLDRYGSSYGQFISPAGTPNWARALPPGVEKLPLNTYIINKPIENVLSGTSTPWFGQIGGGIQYYLGTPYGQNIKSLLRSGHLLEIK